MMYNLYTDFNAIDTNLLHTNTTMQSKSKKYEIKTQQGAHFDALDSQMVIKLVTTGLVTKNDLIRIVGTSEWLPCERLRGVTFSDTYESPDVPRSRSPHKGKSCKEVHPNEDHEEWEMSQNESVAEYFDNYFGDNLNEDTSDEDIMQAVYDLMNLCDAVCEAVGIDESGRVRKQGLNLKSVVPSESTANESTFKNPEAESTSNEATSKGLKIAGGIAIGLLALWAGSKLLKNGNAKNRDGTIRDQIDAEDRRWQEKKNREDFARDREDFRRFTDRD